MHTVELLEQSLATAQRLGYRIRHEWLGGSGGGACEFSGQKWVFVDLALSIDEQLEQVTDVLRDDTSIHIVEMPDVLARHLKIKHAA